ncbi:MAG: prepilin-type N-terminal cleavage/methylation domain-containing protein [Chthoniobacterales bacterium]
MRRNRQAFTLIEISISVLIMLLLLVMAVPSLQGVMADRRLRRSYDDLNKFVRLAQQRSVEDRRPYLIEWRKDHLILRPEAFAKGEDPKVATATFPLQKGDAFLLTLPAALTKNPPAEWVFWPAGICEPATVSYKGVPGSWTANYSSLTARGELSNYATN